MTTTDSAASRTPGAAARCAAITRKTGQGTIKILWLLVTGFAGLLVGEWVITKSVSLGVPPGEWRHVLLHVIGAVAAIGVFWFAYDLPGDVRDLWRDSRERKA